MEVIKSFVQATKAEVALCLGTKNMLEERPTKKRKMNDEAHGTSKDNTGHRAEEQPKKKPKEVAEVQYSTTLTAHSSNGNDAEGGDEPRKEPGSLTQKPGMLIGDYPSNGFGELKKEFEKRILKLYAWNISASKKLPFWTKDEAIKFVDYVFDYMLGELRQRLLDLKEPCSKQARLGHRETDISQRARSAGRRAGHPFTLGQVLPGSYYVYGAAGCRSFANRSAQGLAKIPSASAAS
jgi:hypothetical protein